MPSRPFIKWLFCLGMFITATRAFAQQLSITTYTAKDGAPALGSTRIFQDSKGWMWFTDGENVIRYDGYQFKTIPLARECKTEFVYRVFELNEQVCVMAYPYVVKVVADSLVPFHEFPRELNLLNQIQHKDHLYFLGRKGLFVYKEGKFTPFITDDSLNLMTESTSLVPFGDTLLLSHDAGNHLLVFDMVHRSLYRFPVPVRDLRADAGGRVYLLSQKKLSRLDRLDFVNNSYKPAFSDIPFKISFQSPSMFLVDQSGNTWILDQFSKLVRKNSKGEWSSYTEHDGLPSLWFNHAMLDRENNLWISFIGGIAKVNYTIWDRYTVKEGLLSNIVHVIKQQEGKVFVNTASGLNVYVDNRMKMMHDQHGKPFQCVDFVLEGEKIYFIRANKLFQARTRSFHVVEEKILASFPNNPAQIIKDSQGNLLMPSRGGIYTWNGRRIMRYNDSSHIHRLMIDRNHQLWAGEYGGGLHRYEINYSNKELTLKHREYVHQFGEGYPLLTTIRSLSLDREGNIIAGTRHNGVFILQEKNGKTVLTGHFDKGNSLMSNVAWALSSDRYGNTWIASGNGLERLRQVNGHWVLESMNEKRQIDLANNVVASDEFVWIGSQLGVFRFPIQEEEPANEFRVELLNVLSGNKTIAPGTQRFPYRQNNFSFEFSANSFLNERRVLYTYRMMGTSDTGWSKPAPFHSVNYSSLVPGKYRFQVQARNVNGKWSSNTAIYAFEIKKPYWQTIWFKAFLIGLLAVLFYLIYRYRLKQVVKLQQMRNNISRNLHDDIGATLSNIGILNELARRNMDHAEKANSYLLKAGDDIQHISESLSDIVWNINPKYDNLDNLFIRMKRYAADMLDGRGIRSELIFPVDSDKIKPVMDMDKRRDFYLIFKEAVNNLVKYSEAKNARVEVEFVDHSISLTVADDGKGFEPGKAEGNGLQNIRHRAKRLNAPLMLETAPGKGTVIRMQMKLK